MPLYLKQSTASQEIPLGYFVDATDGNTEETALTIANTDIKLWLAGATTLANKNSGGATHISNGIYYCVLDATDTATLGSLVVFVHVSGALAVRVECVVLAANVYDSLIGGGDVLDVSATQLAGQTITASGGVTFPAATLASTTNITAGTITTVTTTTTATNVTNIASAERDAIADAILNRDMSTGTDSGSATVRTMRQALRFLRNKWSMSGTTLTVCKEDDSTTSWTGTVTTDSSALPITGNDPAS